MNAAAARPLGFGLGEQAISNYYHFEISIVDDVHVMQIRSSQLTERRVVTDWEEELLDYTASQRPKQLVISLNEVTKFSSENIGALLKVRRDVLANEGALKLADLPPMVREVFRMTRLDLEMFDIRDTTEAALKAFAED